MSIIQGVGSGEVSAGFYPFPISESARFNSADSDFLTFTPSSAGEDQIFTLSFWLKRSKLGANQAFFSAGADTSNIAQINFQDDDKIRIWTEVSGTVRMRGETSAVFRDVGAWYNIVWRYNANTPDTKLFVNGVEQTVVYDTAITTGSTVMFSTTNHDVGRRSDNNVYFDGYLAEVIALDGTAVSDASNFGELKNDIWVPKNYSGSYGTNGFRLQFLQSGTGTGSSSTIGADTSGGNNHFTSSGHPDQMSDSPTNNHCTFNPISALGHQFAEGNLKATLLDGEQAVAVSTFELKSIEKSYAEFTMNSTTSSNYHVGIIGQKLSSNRFLYNGGTGQKVVNGSASSYGSTWTTGDVIGVTYDNSANEVEFYKNGVSQTAVSFSIESEDAFLCVFDGDVSATSTFTANFGQQSFAHTPPSGHSALNTANLPDPAIDPNDDETPDQYMDTVVYTPNNGTLSVTGLEFQPDWVWIKDRTTDISHAWFDVLRGTTTAGSINTALGSNRADKEGNSNGVLSSFDSNGFTVAGGSSSSNPRALVNKGTTADDYVAWCWKAGGSGSSISVDSISSGVPSIASTVSASTESGFSLVKWTATGSVGTVAHGLSQKPEMIIYKSIDVSGVNWIIGHAGNPNGFSDRLQFTDGVISSNNSGAFNLTEPTNQVMTIGSFSNTNNKDHIAYVFHSVDGFSKFGHYLGNGTIGDTFVFTGFRPAFVMIKSNDSSTNWSIFDNARNLFNEADEVLEADESIARSTNSNGPDLLSNGFKVRGNVGNWNHNDERYIYMAFAEQPFKYANAR